jgi:hypothetical protein
MTSEQRRDALERLGYTHREASFLSLAALHGGYFLRRQFCSFIRKEIGGTANALVEKLLTQGHATVLPALNNTKIYHLANRPFYALLGESDNRNRREHSPGAMKRRLIGLDFVLANPQHRYLATELEKVEYFSGILGIPQSALPYKRYVSRKSPSTTTRYFVDKFPLFLSNADPVETRLRATFVFVDEGLVTLSAFENYLYQYAELWRALRSFRVIYASDSRRLFQAAARRFQSFGERFARLDGDPNAVLAARLIAHFAARTRYENGDFSSFSRQKLIQLRNETAEFSATKYQELFLIWKAQGDEAVTQRLAPKSRPAAATKADFSTHFIDHSYGFLGNFATTQPVYFGRARPDTPPQLEVSER